MRMNRHQVPDPFSGRDSTMAVPKLKVSKAITEGRDRDERRGQVLGVRLGQR
jgi:hypothetical protein